MPAFSLRMDWPHSVKELRKLIFGILPDVMINSGISVLVVNLSPKDSHSDLGFGLNGAILRC